MQKLIEFYFTMHQIISIYISTFIVTSIFVHAPTKITFVSPNLLVSHVYSHANPNVNFIFCHILVKTSKVKVEKADWLDFHRAQKAKKYAAKKTIERHVFNEEVGADAKEGVYEAYLICSSILDHLKLKYWVAISWITLNCISIFLIFISKIGW